MTGEQKQTRGWSPSAKLVLAQTDYLMEPKWHQNGTNEFRGISLVPTPIWYLIALNFWSQHQFGYKRFAPIKLLSAKWSLVPTPFKFGNSCWLQSLNKFILLAGTNTKKWCVNSGANKALGSE